MRAKTLSTRRPQRGVTLIEALVSITIFSLGLMGIAALQLQNMHAASDAKNRAVASMFAEELASLAMSDYANATNYVTASSCATGTACDRWKSKVASTLPNGLASVTYDAATEIGKLTIEITWKSATDSSSTNKYTSISNLKAVQAL